MPRITGTIPLAVLACLLASPASAQALDGKTQDAIVGTPVKQEEATASAMQTKVLAAIEQTGENLSNVRKASNAERVEIVFLSDAAREAGGLPPEIQNGVKKHEDEIVRLRQEIEANALLFHAIDSRRVLMQDVVAVDFETPANIVIYAAARPSQ